jgi:hypothetical protein
MYWSDLIPGWRRRFHTQVVVRQAAHMWLRAKRGDSFPHKGNVLLKALVSQGRSTEQRKRRFFPRMTGTWLACTVSSFLAGGVSKDMPASKVISFIKPNDRQFGLSRPGNQRSSR